MSAQDRTLQQYHEFMRINSVAHLLRVGREVGLLAELGNGQRTAEQLVETLSLKRQPTVLLLDALVAIGIVEKYDDDYALSRAAQLLSQYDADLGDQRWNELADTVRGKAQPRDDIAHHAYNAATQWIHTAAAIQAAEILDVGGEQQIDTGSGLKILDLGCGAAVWSCAMGHRDPQAKITAVDREGALVAANAMALSIELGDRFATIEGNPQDVEIPTAEFDLVILAQRLQTLNNDQAQQLLNKAITATAPGGRVVVIDLFRGPTKPNLTESIEALKLEMETDSGQMRTLESSQAMMNEAGLESIQFSFIAASQANLGLMVGVKGL